jgi:methylated-DNA-[protein]-cysteine S-methyltransferase
LGAAPGEPPADIAAIIAMVRRYAAAKTSIFRRERVCRRRWRDARGDLCAQLRQVPHGETLTYGELAKRAGYPGQAREIGEAMGKNPVPLIVPCHRVVAAGGKIGGFPRRAARSPRKRCCGWKAR